MENEIKGVSVGVHVLFAAKCVMCCVCDDAPAQNVFLPFGKKSDSKKNPPALSFSLLMWDAPLSLSKSPLLSSSSSSEVMRGWKRVKREEFVAVSVPFSLVFFSR